MQDRAGVAGRSSERDLQLREHLLDPLAIETVNHLLVDHQHTSQIDFVHDMLSNPLIIVASHFAGVPALVAERVLPISWQRRRGN